MGSQSSKMSSMNGTSVCKVRSVPSGTFNTQYQYWCKKKNKKKRNIHKRPNIDIHQFCKIGIWSLFDKHPNINIGILFKSGENPEFLTKKNQY